MLLNGADALALLSMTPFAWKATEAVKHQLAAETAFSCETDFLIRVYRRKPDSETKRPAGAGHQK